MKKLNFFLSLLFTFYVLHVGHSQTTVIKNNDQWQLTVDGKPFDVKGATFGYIKDVQNYDSYFKDLKFLGVNSIRTWATGKETKELLDAAHKYDIKIMMGIWMRHGRPGMEDDDRFDYLKDKKGIEDMYENAISFVTEHKDHPAVLTWGIGNEVYLNIATDPEKEAYSKLLERICKEIKRIDPNHPITSVEAWTFGLDWWQKHVPSIDIYGLNAYGFGASMLQEELDKHKINTEFGVRGEWDIKEEVNGVKREPSDEEKYESISKGYSDWISNKPNNLGVYVFHYDTSDKFIGPWLTMFYKDHKRPQYWATRKAYTGKDPVNSVPAINSFNLSTNEAKSKTWIPVTLDVNDAENDQLDISFSYNQRTGSRQRRDQILPVVHRGNLKEGFEIQLPQENGPVKIYANVIDSEKNMGIASTGIMIKDKKASKRKFLVPKAELPFYVYQEGNDMPFAPSGYMGNMSSLSHDEYYTENVKNGKKAFKITYDSKGGWYGLAFQDPANDWGDIMGGYNLEGAKSFSFWAKTNEWNVKAKFGFGLIEKDKKFPDSAIVSKEFELSKQWQKYTIPIKKADLSCIRTGFVIFGGSAGKPFEIYLDDIVFE